MPRSSWPSDAEAFVRSAGYQLDHLAGTGATGSVYQARGLSDGRVVAIKLLHERSETLRQRFLREARLTTSLRHPHLVEAYDAVTDEAGRALLVMEFVCAPSLRDRLDEGGVLTEAETVTLLAQIGSALAYAHQEGVVHRDVKPSNLLLSSAGVRLCNLGLARDLDATTLTEEGAWVGTYDYFAPEQVLGQPVGPGADVFSLGATCYHALTGRVPFPAKDMVDRACRIAFDQPLAIQRLCPRVSRKTVSLLDAMLEKDPAHRPSAQEVATSCRV